MGLAYLLALFCKESAIILPGLAVTLVLVFAPGNLPTRLRKCLPVFWLLIPLLIYLGLRAEALAPVRLQAAADTAASTSDVDLMLNSFKVPSGNRLLQVSGLGYESIRIMLWPFPITIAHKGFSRFEQIAGFALHLALLAVAFYQLRRKRYGLLMGLVFFYVAMLPASRIIGDPGASPHLAERYLYFPTVGLAIALAFGFRFLVRRFDVLLPAAAVLLVLILLIPLTWARNAVWASEVQLFESEYSHGNRTEPVLVWLTAAQLKNNAFQRVAEICDRHVRVQRRSAKLSTHCAVAYNQLGRLKEAERAYLFGTSQKAVRAIAHANLGRFYLSQGRWQDAKDHFELAIRAEKMPANKAYRRGHMLVRLYPSDRRKLFEAKAEFEKALELQPAHAGARLWLTRVNRALAVR